MTTFCQISSLGAGQGWFCGRDTPFQGRNGHLLSLAGQVGAPVAFATISLTTQSVRLEA